MFTTWLSCDDDCRDPDCGFAHEHEFEDLSKEKVALELETIHITKWNFSHVEDVPENVYVVTGFIDLVVVEIFVKGKHLKKLGYDLPGDDWDGIWGTNFSVMARGKSFEEDPNGELVVYFMTDDIDFEPYVEAGN